MDMGPYSVFLNRVSYLLFLHDGFCLATQLGFGQFFSAGERTLKEAVEGLLSGKTWAVLGVRSPTKCLLTLVGNPHGTH